MTTTGKVTENIPFNTSKWDLLQAFRWTVVVVVVVVRSYGGFADGDKSHLMKTLVEAEEVANSAAIQLASFKDAMEEEFAVCCFFYCWLFLQL